MKKRISQMSLKALLFEKMTGVSTILYSLRIQVIGT